MYIPPHRNGAQAEHRYSKEQLLGLCQNQQENNDLSEGLPGLCVGGWEPNAANGVTAGSWGRRDDPNKDHTLGVDVCWEKDGTNLPLSLTELTEEEKEVRRRWYFLQPSALSISQHYMNVNSTVKPPTQSMSKDGTGKDGLSLRKSSVSQGSGAYNLSSPTSTRSSTRRRDTSDSFPFPPTHPAPSSSRFSRDESSAVTPPPALLRRRTDFKENETSSAADEKEKDKAGDSGAPFGGLKRSTTGSFGTNTNTSGSPWSASQGSGFPPMGAFGSFNLGGAGAATAAGGDRRPGFGPMRSGSRFKDLMSKDVSDDRKELQEKVSLPNLGAVMEQEQQGPTSDDHRPTSKDIDPFPEDELKAGSAALGGGLDTSPPRSRAFPGFGSSRQDSREESLFGAFGMTSDTVPFPGLLQQRDFPQQTPQQQTSEVLHEPMSPTDTNPFQSPENDRSELDDLDTDVPDPHQPHLPGLGGYGTEQGLPGLGGFGGIGRGSGSHDATASDRSQTSSAGARGLPGFGSLGGLPGLGGPSPWSAAPGLIGTPTRDRSGLSTAFGESLFSSAGDGLAGLGSSSLLGAVSGAGSIGGSGAIGRTGGSRIGSNFSQSLEDQFRGSEPGRQSLDDGMDRQQNLAATMGRGAFGPGAIGASAPIRDAESPFRSGRGLFEDGFGMTSHGLEPTSAVAPPIGLAFNQAQTSVSMPPPTSATATGAPTSFPGQRSGPPQASSVASPSLTQPPVAQVRQMVMPDRMKWVYKDPEGMTQGPFSGLEMHDWYKAGFFTPELLIKKVEDPEYEPLAQLIRRIGNSREPFLVPQIGVPHDPPLNQRNWSSSVGAPPASAQVPFPNSFPSFGTTLTADQQNALERRKQEEQYLMARQKEHLAQQQLIMRQQMQMQIQGQAPGAPSGLHHHSSAHSLHSQPSFGSITSPGGYQASPTQGPMHGGQPVPGFFEGQFPSAPAGGLGLRNAGTDALPNIREEELPGFMERLNLARQAQAAGIPLGQQQTTEPAHAQQIQQMMSDRARLQAEQDAQQSQLSREQHERMMLERYQQFHELRGPQELEQHNVELDQHEGIHPSLLQQRPPALEPLETDIQPSIEPPMMVAKHHEQPSLTEQVQKAQTAKEKAQKPNWNQVDLATMQLPTRQDTSSPMPAPIAQRKSNVAETLAAESRSRSQTPSIETPSASIAPWAKESIEAPKGPSLKEIQEMEAKRVAQQEELAAAARKAQLEKELQAQAAAAHVTPGLPSSSTWGSNQSPGSSTGATPSVWAKASVGKKGPVTAVPAKKTLDQIQREEEARKQQRLAAAAQAAQATSPSGPPGLSSGKTYAGLAGKGVQSPPVPSGGGAWTTVGAGGKIKTPAVPLPTGPSRSISGNVVPVTPTIPGTPGKPKGSVRSTTMASQNSNKTNAMEEFKKWAANELKPHLNKDITNGKCTVNGLRVRTKKFAAPDLVEGLIAIGSDIDIITEAVHSSSNSIESRHFAEEFVRRKKLADKGIVDASSLGGAKEVVSGNGGGWSEVAKKNPVKEEAPNNFKVVAGKKKGGRK